MNGRISASLAAHLDNEWMPQEVHSKMGEVCKQAYIQCREKGDHDISSIMLKIAEDLEERWDDFDADAFVNAYDIGNYVADYLTQRVGLESLACSNEIVDPDE